MVRSSQSSDAEQQARHLLVSASIGITRLVVPYNIQTEARCQTIPQHSSDAMECLARANDAPTVTCGFAWVTGPYLLRTFLLM